MFALRKISFSRKDHQTPSLVGLCWAASRSKTKLLSRARALGLALNSSEKCQMCKFHNIPANYVHQALLCMLATVTQILLVPDSFKLLEIIYGYKFDSFFIFILRFQKTIMYPLSFRSFLRFESRALHID